MGAKLFAWIGGLAMFFGVLFFVKLSIERGWLPPGLRVVIGFITGLGLLGSGWLIQKRKPYAVLAHTLSATGVVVLYGVTYAAHALYRIPPFDSAMATFGIMSAITATAFFLSGRMKAQVIAVLGLLGGFMTPILCSTGEDNPFGLFSYIALLDLGVLAVAWRQGWRHLSPLAAIGTVIMQAGWLGTFFVSSGYAEGAASWIPVSVFLTFSGLFAAAAILEKPAPAPAAGDGESALGVRSVAGGAEGYAWDFGMTAALIVAGGALLAGYVFLGFPSLMARPGLLYSLVFGTEILVMAAGWRRAGALPACAVFAGLVFLHLMSWTQAGLTTELLPWGLGIFLLAGVLHSAFATAWQRRHGGLPEVAGWAAVLPLGLMLRGVSRLHDAGWLLWPALFLAVGLVLAMAWRSGKLGPVAAALGLTLLTAGTWFFRSSGAALVGGGGAELTVFLVMLGSFAILFAGAGAVLGKRSGAGAAGLSLSVASAVMPFFLLILVVLKLRMEDPGMVFALAAVLAVFLLGLARFARQALVVPTALVCVTLLYGCWHVLRMEPSGKGLALGWSLGFLGLFQVYAWVFRKSLAEQMWPWITASLAAVGFFFPVHDLVETFWPEVAPGWVPAGFALLPFAGMEYVRRCQARENPQRLTQLAWLAGTGLFFVTLIFPIQFDRQWITIGWALEGAALCWLFGRVPHPGLRNLGSVLLAVSFVRLAVNPDSWHGPLPEGFWLWNWQLYAFGTVTAALLTASAVLRDTDARWQEIRLPVWFRGLAGILLFVLLNIEIATAFTPAGFPMAVFSWGTDFGRAMTTTISWSLFALALLGLGFRLRNAPTRYAGLGLLGAAMVKLFLHDLENIGSGYRIAAFLAVAVIALVASWLYQRFTALAGGGDVGAGENVEAEAGADVGAGADGK
ncbi:MAG: hypothetical protein JWL81_639 [Verrucomicrobiales bacterium]|nr:hypothetical protein [Verrucomicrobiales bacterium]